MSWRFINISEFKSVIESNAQLVVLETCTDSQNIFTTDLPDKILLIAGSESHGIPKSILKQSMCKVFIPMPGECKSLNVTHALSIAAFEWYRQKSIGI